MINLLRAEIFRIINTKAFKYSFMATIGATIFSLCIDNIWLISINTLDGPTYGFNIGMGEGRTYIDFIRNAIAPSIIIYIIGISFTTSIMVKTLEGGILKNLVPYGHKRWKIYLANVVSIILVMIFFILIQMGGTLVGSLIIFRPELNIGELIRLLGASLISYVFIISAMISIYSMILVFMPGASVISVLAMVEILLFTMFGHMMPESVVNFTPLTLLRKLASYPEEASSIGIVVCMTLIIITTIDIGRIAFEKKEIK